MDFDHVKITGDGPLYGGYPSFLEVLNVLFGHCFGLGQLVAVGNVAGAIAIVGPTVNLSIALAFDVEQHTSGQ